MNIVVRQCETGIDFANAEQLFSAKYPNEKWSGFGNLAQLSAQQWQGPKTYIAESTVGVFLGAAIAQFDSAVSELTYIASVNAGKRCPSIEKELIRTICASHRGDVRINLTGYSGEDRQQIVSSFGRGEIRGKWFVLDCRLTFSPKQRD
ncbi:MAG: hypothetical protein HYR90_01330 [Candidatus Andersenbacteria bacterium]|nr:hypothetical protein [Candidatus Andersenbacteria bacterium]MBI3250508.1 hypothetical protein [Candidatus Andersenbacteria bacterium]